jgi:hypothetical protein
MKMIVVTLSIACHLPNPGKQGGWAYILITSKMEAPSC